LKLLGLPSCAWELFSSLILASFINFLNLPSLLFSSLPIGTVFHELRFKQVVDFAIKALFDFPHSPKYCFSTNVIVELTSFTTVD
jgi:hypothetical protein